MSLKWPGRRLKEGVNSSTRGKRRETVTVVVQQKEEKKLKIHSLAQALAIHLLSNVHVYAHLHSTPINLISKKPALRIRPEESSVRSRLCHSESKL